MKITKLTVVYWFCFFYAEKDNLFKAQGSPNGPCIADIDSDHKDPQMCSLYASDIYDNFLCREVCIANTIL